MTVNAADPSREYAFDVESTATLTASVAEGHRFAGWTGGACAEDVKSLVCVVPAGTVGSVAATATFEAFRSGLAVSVSGPGAAGGSVALDFGVASPMGVANQNDRFTTSTAVTALAGTTLTATTADGYAFSGWTPAGALSCAGGTDADVCVLAFGAGDSATVEAAFTLVATTLTVSANANGRVRVFIRSSLVADVEAGTSNEHAFNVESTARLRALPFGSYSLLSWTLPSGLECADDSARNVCELANVVGSVAATATFRAVQRRLEVSVAGAGGSVAITGAAVGEAMPGKPYLRTLVSSLPLSLETTLTAMERDGYAFSGWTLTGGLSCEARPDPRACLLGPDLDSVLGDATAEAAFTAIPTTLTVSVVGDGGSVAVDFGDGGSVVTLNAADPSRDFAFNVESTATLTATADDEHHLFAGWTGGACADEGPICVVPARTVGSVAATATFVAFLSGLAVSVSGPGAAGGSVALDFGVGSPMGVANQNVRFTTSTAVAKLPRTTLTATTADGYAFSGWTLSSTGLSCAEGATSSICTLVVVLDDVESLISVEAAFTLVATTLTVSAGPNGSVNAIVRGVAATEPVGAGSSQDFAFDVESTATLRAVPASDHAFLGWTLSSGLSCAGGTADNVCMLEAKTVGSVAATATFVGLVATTLTVSAGPNGSVNAIVRGVAATEPVGAGSSQDFAFNVESTARLTAVPAPGYRLVEWTGACAEDMQGLVCVVPAGTVGSVAAKAIFTANHASLALLALVVSSAAESNFLVEAYVDLGLGASRPARPGLPYNTDNRPVLLLIGSTLTATTTGPTGAGYRFAGWMLSAGLSCEGGLDATPCVLAGDIVGSEATATATFTLVATTLTVSAGPNGSVNAIVRGVAATEPVGAGSSQDFAFDVESTATLRAVPASGHAFLSWTLSSGLSCVGGTADNVCMLGAKTVGSVAATATFEVATVSAWQGPGSVSLSLDRNTFTANPYYEGAFVEWKGGPDDGCDGTTDLVCDLSSVVGRDSTPLAVFRPFAVGIKSLVFGFGYAVTPDYFRVNFRANQRGGFSPVPGLGRLEPSSTLQFLKVSVHLLPWSLASYLTEACNGDDCGAADGGERILVQADSLAATGYFKTPASRSSLNYFGSALALSTDGATLAVGAYGDITSSTGTFVPTGVDDPRLVGIRSRRAAGAAYIYRRSSTGQWTIEAVIKAPKVDPRDSFGTTLALSADGTTLAVGAPEEDSASTGTFTAPDGEGYQAALDSDDAGNSGAVTVYRRSGSAWSVEAFVKAPKAGSGDRFGEVLALSADGATLAVGAPEEDSASTGTFTAPDGEGYQAALDSGDAGNSGAVTVYRRSGSAWSVETFVKAPVAGFNDQFGTALALDSSGTTLAVGAPFEASASAGVFTAPDGEGYQAALDSDDAGNSGAVTVYRRSGSAWSVETFVKAPVAGGGDQFGTALALDSSGTTLAVGAPFEGSASTGTFTAPDGEGYQAALDSDDAGNSGAVTVYRRSGSEWSVETFVKAPVAGFNDQFGTALALDSSGATLAVGAPFEASASAGVFAAPDGEGYQAALDSDDAGNSGAVTVYRRSGSAWSVEAFVKASNTGASDQFGSALALSADSATLAVGAEREGSDMQLLQPISGDRSRDSSGNVLHSGAVYLY